MTIKERISELSAQRKSAVNFIREFSEYEGKFYRSCKKACQMIRDWQEQNKSTLFDSYVINQLSGKFDFSGLRDYIEDKESRIHALDTLDTLDLEEYIAKTKALIECKNRLREAFGKEYVECVKELNNLTGFHF